MADIPAQRTDEADAIELMTRAAGGDQDALASIYRAYERVVLKFVYYRVGNKYIAQDIAGQTWLRALGRLHGWVAQGKDPGAWLVTIAHHLVVDHFKSGRNRYEVVADTRSMLADGDQPIAPDHDGDAREAVRELYTAIALLSEDQRTALMLRLNGLSLTETARRMGRSVGAVKALEHRAKLALRRRLTVGAEDLHPEGSKSTLERSIT